MIRIIRIVYAIKVHRSGLELLSSKGFETIVYDKSKPLEEWLCENLKGARALVVAPFHRIGGDILDCGDIELLVIHGSGYENINLSECSRRGICVVNTPDAIAESVAEHALGLTLSLLRNIAYGNRFIRKGLWGSGPAPRPLIGTTLRGKTVGIIGLGRIGSSIAKLFRSLGNRIIYWSRRRKPEVEHALDIEYRDLYELLGEADIVIVSLALNKETIGFIDYEKLSKMKKNSILVNISRGKIVVEKDLVRALREGIIAGAALDVFEEEPIRRDNPLTRLENVVLTPHIAGYTWEAMIETSRMVAQTIIDYFSGKIPHNALNIEVCKKNIGKE